MKIGINDIFLEKIINISSLTNALLLDESESGLFLKDGNYAIIPVVHNKCAFSCHFERSKAESRNLF